MNVFSFLIDAANRGPTAPAVMSEERLVTFSELLEQSLLLKETLVAQGIRPGMGLGLMMSNSPEFVIGLFAGLACGAVVMPLSPELKEQEFNRTLELVPMAAIVHDGSLNTHTHATGTSRQGPFHIALRSEEFHGRVACGIPDAAVIRFTSGTTGSSKGVVLSHRTVAERSQAAIQGLELSTGDTVLWVLPMAYHFVVSILTYVRFGVALVLPSDSSAKTLSRTAQRFGPTVLYASPDVIDTLSSETETVALPPTMRVISTSTGLSSDLAATFEKRFRIPVSQFYGLIEVGLPLGAINGRSYSPQSVGIALPSYKVAILDDRGRPLPANEIGRLAIQGPGMFDAYLSPYRTREDVLASGWFLTGDLATQGYDGSITVRGRERSVIHISGHKVFPEEVEGILNSFPGIRSSRVFGITQPNGSESVVAEVTIQEGRSVDVESLRAYAGERLSPYKIPSKITEVSAIPLTKTGKVIRAA